MSAFGKNIYPFCSEQLLCLKRISDLGSHFWQRAVEQVIGREVETATLLPSRPLNLSGLGSGFVLR
jgi:hypothetical protein